MLPWTRLPDPEPASAEPRPAPDAPPAAELVEIVSVVERTQQTDVRELRASEAETQAVDPAEVRRAAGLDETRAMPVLAESESLPRDESGRNTGPHPSPRTVLLSSPMAGPARVLPVKAIPAAARPLFRDELPGGTEAITQALPVARSIVVQLAADMKPLIRPGAEVCTVTAERAAASVHDQLANAT